MKYNMQEELDFNFMYSNRSYQKVMFYRNIETRFDC